MLYYLFFHQRQSYEVNYGPMCKKGKGSPYSITKHRVPELIPVLGNQPAGDVSHKNPAVGCHYFLPGLQLPSQPLKRAATNLATW